MNRSDFDAAAQAGIITPDQAIRLAGFFDARPATRPPATIPPAMTPVATTPAAIPAKFDFSHLLWYAGALIVIGALSLFTTLAFDRMGGRALAATAIAYAAGFTVIGHRLWQRAGLRTPAGLLIACAVGMTPLAIYGVQAEYGLWPMPFGDPGTYGNFAEWVNASWIYMDIGTVLVGILALRLYPFPFIAAIVAVALWFLSEDLTPWVFHRVDYDWTMREEVSLWFGLVLILVAWGLDLRRWPAGDFAFWLHLGGLLAFWGGLSMMDSDSEIAKAVYCLINVALVILAIFLMRRAYAVFGAFGIMFYLAHLAESVFKDSLLFPLALSAIGLAVIGLGIWYFRRRHRLVLWMATALPPALRNLRPAHARADGA